MIARFIGRYEQQNIAIKNTVFGVKNNFQTFRTENTSQKKYKKLRDYLQNKTNNSKRNLQAML